MNTTFGCLPSFHPQTSNLLLTVSVHRPVFQEDGYCVLFLGLSLPPSTLFSLSSSPLLCPSLYYSAEGSSHLRNAPVHTGIIEDSRCTSARTCTHVCVLKIEKGQRLDWQVLLIRNFKWLYVIFPTRQRVQATYTQLLSFNGGHWLHSWCQSPVATVKCWHSNRRSELPRLERWAFATNHTAFAAACGRPIGPYWDQMRGGSSDGGGRQHDSLLNISESF